MSGDHDSGSVVRGGEDTTHQCPRVEGSGAGLKVIHTSVAGQSCPIQIGQHDCCVTDFEDGISQVVEVSSCHPGDLGTRAIAQEHSYCTTLTRQGKKTWLPITKAGCSGTAATGGWILKCLQLWGVFFLSFRWIFSQIVSTTSWLVTGAGVQILMQRGWMRWPQCGISWQRMHFLHSGWFIEFWGKSRTRSQSCCW